MTTQTRNVAATQILEIAIRSGHSLTELMNQALAAERRATVERIRAALDDDSYYGDPDRPRGRLNAILDEEAAR